MHRIVFLCYDMKDGGSPQVLSSILFGLHRDLFDPLLVTYTDTRAYPVPDGIPEQILHVEGGGNLLRKLAANLTAVVRLRRVLSKEQPEIALGMGGITNWALILAAKLLRGRTAIIIGEHGTGALNYRKDRVTSRLIGLLNGFLYPSADRIIAISEGVRDYLVKELKLPGEKIVPIANPVDVRRIRELSQEKVDHPWLVHRDKPVILWVGRMEAVKGLPGLIGAFERVLKRVDARLMMVGEGSERTAVHRLVVQKGLEEKVYFAGYDSNPYRYMARCTVLAFPSLGGEGFPMVLVEAMALGLPIVSTDCVAGPAEILQNGRCGILVPVGDEDAMAQGIVSLISDSTLRQRLAEEAAKRVADFDPAKVVASYERLFLEVCKNSRAGGPAADAI